MQREGSSLLDTGQHQPLPAAPDAAQTGAPAPPQPASTLRATLAALLASAVLAVIFTWHAIANLTSGVIGGDVDGFENVWNFWWVKSALLDLHRNPLFTDYIYYPTGVSLRYHTLNPLNGLLTLPLNQALGYVPTLNLFLVAALCLTCFCAFLLVRDLVGNPWAAFAGGALFAFANRNIVFFYTGGQTNLIALWWVPLYFFLLLRALHGVPRWSPPLPAPLQDTFHRWPYTALAVLSLVAMSLTDWQYVMLSAFATLLYFAVFLLARRPRAEKASVLRTLVAVGGFYALLAFPTLVWPMLSEMAANPWLIVSGQSSWHSLDLADLLSPGLGNPGYLALALALAGLVYAWRSGTGERLSALFWAATAAVFYVLALGPELLFSGQATGIPLPYALLQKLPLFSIGRDPGRFNIIATLAVGVLAAFGLRAALSRLDIALTGRAPVPLRVLAPAAVVVLMIAVSLLGFVRQAWTAARADPPDFPAFYAEIASEPDDYALLELPLFTDQGRGENHYMMYQVLHEKQRFSGRWARDHKLDNPDNYVKTTPLLRDLWMAAQPEARRDIYYPENDIIPTPDYASIGAPLLNLLRVRYIVLYKEAISPDLQEQYAPLLAAILGPGAVPYRDEPLVTVYRVPDHPAPPDPFALAIGNGWYPAASNPAGRIYRWADNATLIPGTNEPASPRSELYVANASTEPARATLRFTAYPFAAPRTLVVRMAGVELARIDLDPSAPERETALDLTVPPGSHAITFDSPEPALPTGDPNDARLLTFGMYGVSLEPAP